MCIYLFVFPELIGETGLFPNLIFGIPGYLLSPEDKLRFPLEISISQFEKRENSLNRT